MPSSREPYRMDALAISGCCARPPLRSCGTGHQCAASRAGVFLNIERRLAPFWASGCSANTLPFAWVGGGLILLAAVTDYRSPTSWIVAEPAILLE